MLKKRLEGTVVRVTFNIPAPLTAQTITLVGEFNNWSETATPLLRSGEGWSTTMDLPPNHSFQYRYLADGRWLNDWSADRYEPNEFGGANSVVYT